MLAIGALIGIAAATHSLAESPGPDKEANWLPASKGKFGPILRLYWPTDSPPTILDGSWKPPAIKITN